MKRRFNTALNSNTSNLEANEVLEGLVVAVTDISHNQGNKAGKYWTALVCDVNQNINRITKYLSLKVNCSLHTKIVEHLKDQSGLKLTKLRLTGDQIYTAINETMIVAKPILFTPSYTRVSTIQDIRSMSDGEHVSFVCKIMDIDPVRSSRRALNSNIIFQTEDDAVVFNNGEKRVQKLKRTTVVADKIDSIDMTIWQNPFGSIQQNACYTIKLAKVKIYNSDVSITTGTFTM